MFQLFRTEYTGSTTTPNTVPTEFVCIMNQARNKNNIKNAVQKSTRYLHTLSGFVVPFSSNNFVYAYIADTHWIHLSQQIPSDYELY